MYFLNQFCFCKQNSQHTPNVIWFVRVFVNDLLKGYYIFPNMFLAFCNSLPTFPSWWVWVDSNYRPHPYQGCALTKLSYRPVLKREGILTFILERLKPRHENYFILKIIFKFRVISLEI